MIDKKRVQKLSEDFISDKDIFLVDVKVSTTNRISVLADKPSGISIDECAMISRHINSHLDREEEDYELKVSSPGIDKAFQVIDQYRMNIGKEVEVTDKENDKVRGILNNVEGDGFEILAEKRKKGKKKEINELSYNFEDVKKVKLIIRFK